VISKNALTFHSWYYLGYKSSNFDLAEIISTSFSNDIVVRGKNLLELISTHPSAAFVIINTSPFFLDISRSFEAYKSISSSFFEI
jgi:hypothetical protein